MDGNQCETIKVAIIGDGCVGKTSIAVRYALDDFRNEHVSTIGASFLQKEITVDSKNVKLQLWDTAGQEMFRSLVPMYLRDARAVLIVYDVSSKKSYLNVPNWLDDVCNGAPEDAKLVLVCNKIDLTDVQVTHKEGMKLAEKRNIPFFEVSAKSGDNISDLFQSIATLVIRSKSKRRRSPDESISLSSRQYGNKVRPKQKCCFR